MAETPATGCLVDDFIRACRLRSGTRKIADATGVELTGGDLLVRSLALRRVLRRHVLEDDEDNVGILLPPAVGSAVVNAAITLDRRVAVNLNYTLSDDILNACLETAGIRHVLTTRKVVDRLGLHPDAPLTFVDELRPRVTAWDKLVAAAQGRLFPRFLLTRLLGAHRTERDDVLTLIFTSGSTGTPKGVMLTHGNVRSNVEAIANLVALRPDDAFLGVLPFFHSFGYTATLWTTLTLDVGGAFHVNPLDARRVGELCEAHRVSVIMTTPTFLRHYLKRCTAEQLRTVDAVVTAAERLDPGLADAFEAKFGTRPVEAYGATELSPLVSCNIPASRTREEGRDRKEGSVGRPALHVSARAVDLESGRVKAPGEVGMLQVSGPNVMKGYYGRPDLTAEVIHDGWYVTGDLGCVDEDGFIQLAGRLSRFSKIGGEMVPHLGVEESINRLLGTAPDGGLMAAVTAVPDPRKGERLVVLHAPLDRDPATVCEALADEGLPRLFIPSPDSWFEVAAIPVLGTGKLALREVRQLALERTGSAAAP